MFFDWKIYVLRLKVYVYLLKIHVFVLIFLFFLLKINVFPIYMPPLRERKDDIMLLADHFLENLAAENNKFTGTVGDIGVFSLNYHKHIHTGEGGIIITNNDYFARRMQLLRNHAETIINKKENLSNMIGHNYRLGEMEAAIGIEQLKKLNKYIKSRVEVAKKLNKGLNKLKGIRLPKIKKSFET